MSLFNPMLDYLRANTPLGKLPESDGFLVFNGICSFAGTLEDGQITFKADPTWDPTVFQDCINTLRSAGR